ncbi:hypothetical protein OSB04_032174 [Centaurea solstitialis]|uniref:Uncharacterized protein n=1 Tax=Centaurea solstitialis TaxID=347529 RepID=A0AA38SN49_9ASTR|nr:hypothetical protein OSB04_032174 [Centaurea solstitialis]
MCTSVDMDLRYACGSSIGDGDRFRIFLFYQSYKTSKEVYLFGDFMPLMGSGVVKKWMSPKSPTGKASSTADQRYESTTLETFVHNNARKLGLRSLPLDDRLSNAVYVPIAPHQRTKMGHKKR